MTPLRLLGLALALLCGLDLLIGVAPAHADPRFPGHGDRITVTLTSDRQWNDAATWYDSSNRFRYQRDVPLTTLDPKTKLWSTSMVYTSRVLHQNVDVGLTSGGRFARCRVAVNGTVVRSTTVRAAHAMALCNRPNPRNP